jgi:hypothetical protein
MNIFVTDYNPLISARNLDDKRVVKMVLESAQLLSTTMHEVGAPDPPYRKTHVNHPCSKWVRESRGNYLWLIEHMKELCLEYSRRYHKIHKCEQLIPIFEEAKGYVPDVPSTMFANCTAFKDEADVRVAYRKQMEDKWDSDIRRPTWYGTDERPF